MTAQPQRRPFTGSCHCGNIRYIVYLTLPHTPPTKAAYVQNFYRCNCTVCHKTGFFHMRLNSSPDDFFLLPPAGSAEAIDPYRDMGDYQCDSKALHFLYCKKCAVRCFIFMGKGEEVKVDLNDVGLSDDQKRTIGVKGSEQEGKIKAWRPKKEGWKEGKRENGCYLSVNGCTLDQEQEGLDLREWSEKKWVCYLQILKADERGEAPRYDRPHDGGMY